MRLGQLSIRNFRVLKDVSITFSDKVVGIVGLNGAGKSSLIEAIAWAFYGNQSARSGREEIQSVFSSPADWCEVSLGFSINEQSYRIIRRLQSASGKGEVKLFRGESTESLGVRETDKFIRDLLGLDWKGFSTSFLARQQELSALSDIPTHLRRDHLAGMLGIERLDRAIKKVKEDGKLAGERVSFYEQQVSGRQTLTGRLEELQHRLEACHLRLPELEAARAKIEMELKQCAEDMAQMQKLETAMLIKRGELDSWHRTARELAVQGDKIDQELTSLDRVTEEVRSLEAETSKLPGLVQQEAVLQQQQIQWAAYEAKRKRNDELQQSLAELQKREAAGSVRRQEIEQELRGLPADAEVQEKGVAQQLEKARQEYSEQQAVLLSSRKLQEKLEAQLQGIRQMGKEAVCDRCLRPLGNDHENIVGHLTNEQQEIARQIDGIEKVLAAQKTAGEQLRIAKDSLELTVRKRYQLTTEQQSVQTALHELAAGVNTTKKQMAALQAELSGVSVLNVDSAEVARLQTAITVLREKSAQMQHAKGRLEQRAVLVADLQAIKEKETAAKQRRCDIEQELQQSAFSEEKYRRLQQQLVELQKNQEEARTAHESAKHESEVIQVDIRAVQISLDQLQAISKNLEAERETLFYDKKLDILFNEFRKQLLAGIRPALAELSSQLMVEMTGGKYSSVTLDADYNLQVMDYGKTYGIDRFSGGEKDLANLCLRLAISLALTESAGLTRSFIILDEVFGSQDESRKELILHAMGNLKQRFPQILLVTHIEDIKDRVEQTIQITPTVHGWSEVTQIGAA